MVKNRTKSIPIYSAVAIGTVLALLVSIAGGLAGAVMMNGEMISENAVYLLTIVVWAIASFAGALVSSLLLGNKQLLPSLLTDVCYYLLLMGIGILFFESNFKSALTALLAVIAGNIPVIFMILNGNPRKGRKKHYKFR